MYLVLGLLGAVVLVFASAYNTLVGRRNRAAQALSSIDVQLTQRYDLIPKLVETVRQFMQHERGLLEEIVRLRGQAMHATAPAERVAADNALTAALGRLNVTVEAYPAVQASDAFVSLQRSLNEVEAQLAAARRAYNGTATDYNNAVQMVPTSIVAGMMGFAPLPMFVAPVEKRADVNMKALFAS